MTYDIILYTFFGSIAQWLVQRTHNSLVVGSSPTGPISFVLPDPRASPLVRQSAKTGPFVLSDPIASPGVQQSARIGVVTQLVRVPFL